MVDKIKQFARSNVPLTFSGFVFLLIALVSLFTEGVAMSVFLVFVIVFILAALYPEEKFRISDAIIKIALLIFGFIIFWAGQLICVDSCGGEVKELIRTGLGLGSISLFIGTIISFSHHKQ